MILLFSSVVLYALTFGVGIFASAQRISSAQIPLTIPQFTFQDILIFLIVFILMTFVILRFGRAARLTLGSLLMLSVFAGGIFFFGSFLGWPWNIVAAIVFLFIVRTRPRVFLHDIGVAVAIGGISGLLGLALTPLWAVGLLAVLSFYDILSVYRTRHMVALAGRMLESGAVFGFLIPGRLRTFLQPVPAALKERSVLVLGSGDVGLPLVLAASSVATSIPAAIMVAGASIIGLLLMQWLFGHQRHPMPMAALPPIAACAIIGYGAAVLLGL